MTIENYNPQATQQLLDAVDQYYRNVIFNQSSTSQGTIAETIKKLVADGADPNARDQENKPLLHKLADCDDTTALTTLITSGADPNIIDDLYGDTILHRLAFRGKADTITAITAVGANPNIHNNFGDYPIHNTLSNLQNPAFVALLKAGANPDTCDSTGKGLVHYLAERGDKTRLEIALDYGSNINLKTPLTQKTAAHFAVFAEETDCLALIINRGGSFDEPDRDGKTPLFYATKHRRLGAVSLLTAHGAKTLNENPFNDRATKVMLLEMNKPDANPDTIFGAISNGANINATDFEGKTLLHTSVARGFPGMIRKLISLGADPDIGDKDGLTPLMMAIRLNYEPCFKALMYGNANPNIDRFGDTMMDVIANPNIIDKNKSNAAHFAVQAPKEFMAALIKARVNLGARDNQGMRPIDLALAQNNRELVKMLRKAMPAPAKIPQSPSGRPLPSSALTLFIATAQPDDEKISGIFGDAQPAPVRRWVDNRQDDLGQKRFGNQR